jgi:hypothetical protein
LRLGQAGHREADQGEAPADEIHDLANNKQKLLMFRGLKRAIEDLATLAEVKV